jgi:hypothetical protein
MGVILRDPFLWVIACLPALVVSYDSNAIYTKPGTIDPWVYYGFFRHLVTFKRDWFPATYYGSRLSWILPGYLLNQLFSPVVANGLLHLSVYYTAVFSFFFLLKNAVDRRTALIGTLLFGFYPYFWAAAGWDYADGAGIAGFLLTMLLLTHGAKDSRRYGYLAAAGAAYAAVIYSNLAWGMFSPLLFLHYAVANRIGRGAKLTQTVKEVIIGAGAGFALVTIVLCLVNHHLDGTYWFYAPSVGFAAHSTGANNQWRKPLSSWIGGATWLALPAAVLMITVGFAVLQRRTFFKRSNFVSVLFVLQFWLAAAILLLMDVRGNSLLGTTYYASYLIPFTFLAIGAQCIRVPKLTDARFIGVVGLALVVLDFHWWGLAPRVWSGMHLTVFLPFWCGLFVISLLAIRFGRTIGVLGLLTSAGILYSYVYVAFRGFGVGDTRNQSVEIFKRIDNGMGAVEKAWQSRPFTALRFWYDGSPSTKYGGELSSLNSTYLWGYTLISDKFPAHGQEAPPINSLIVFASPSKNAAQTAIDSFGWPGQHLEFLSQASIPVAKPQYYLFFFENQPNPVPATEMSASFDAGGQGFLAQAPNGAAAALPPDRWSFCDARACNIALPREADGVHVTTLPGRTAYATEYATLGVPSSGHYRFILKYKMLSGEMYFGALKEDRSAWLTGRHAPPRRDEVDLDLTLHEGEKIRLLIANDRKVDEPSKYVIEEVRALRLIDPQ